MNITLNTLNSLIVEQRVLTVCKIITLFKHFRLNECSLKEEEKERKHYC